MPSPTSLSQTAQLANFLTQLNGSIDRRLLELATARLVDTSAVMIFGSEQPWSRSVIDHSLASGASGNCTVIGQREATTSAMAALANGASAHAFELDDVHEEAISHPGAVVIPAALALAEELNKSGHDLLEAIVIGYEAMGRAGIAVGPASHMLAGFHPTSMSGVFGAAAAAGRLLNFDSSKMNHALGIAASLASGTMEFASSGGMAKRLHAGRAAEGGLTAALLAARGFEGSLDGLAGTYGFCRIFTDEPQLELLTDRLGQRWMLDEITVKPYAACSDIHPMIQATMQLRSEYQFEPGDIESIELEGPTKAAVQNDMDGTTSVMAAQYSAQFNVAAALISDPIDPDTYQPENICLPQFAALQQKVTSIRAAEEFDATYAWKMGGRVIINLSSGKKISATVHGQKGSMHDPLEAPELAAKFSRLTQGRVNPKLEELLWSIDDAEDLTGLAATLRQSTNG
ncbi:MAG: MmgE/PrpD family protein [Actinomycetota bacterium]|nr:MmgE/PrpD family protein [Actinomycetota bacterium]MED5292937.1 MmgE/PrpD family protein [Actinomycetota bacterium]